MLILLVAAGTHVSTPTTGETDMTLAQFVPDELDGWRSVTDETFDDESIFRYMDGAAEVYLSFDFRQLFVRRFTPAASDLEITVELYDMGVAADAFGVFARNRSGEGVGIGQGSEYRSGYLLFWQDRYFVVVFTSEETAETREVVLDLGRSIATAIGSEGEPPRLLSSLPEPDLDPESIRYFHLYTDLNLHYFIADDNILGLGPRVEAVIANYRWDDERPYLLVIAYSDEADAAQAHASFIGHFLSEAGPDGVAQLEDGYWAAAVHTGSHVIAVFDSPTREQAESLLAAAFGRIDRSEP